MTVACIILLLVGNKYTCIVDGEIETCLQGSKNPGF